jgi:DNA repair ATPase RecN
MATKESTSPGPQADFLAMRDVLMLAAFASEARRVLEDIDSVASDFPDIEERLSKLVRARRQWAVYEDTIPEVLDGVAQQLAALAGEEQ